MLENMLRKRGKRIISAVLACVLLAVLFSGCAMSGKDDREEEPCVIGVVTKSSSSGYWMSVVSGIERAAAAYGVTVKILSPDSELNIKMQRKMIHDLLLDDIDIMAISPLKSQDTSYVEQARERGIPVVAYDTKIYDDSVPYIGADNEKIGREIAKTMAGELGGEGTVGIVTGDMEQSVHLERVEGFRDYMEKNTDIRIAFVESGYSNLLVPKDVLDGLLAEHPGIRGIFATSAATALGISDYLRGNDIEIMTVDIQQDALEAVRSSELAALAAQPGYEIGYAMIRYIVENRDKDFSGLEDRILDAEIVTRDNVEEWID